MGDSILGSSNVYSSENIRKFWYIFDKIIDKIDGNVAITNDEMLKEIDNLKFEIIKERKKLQTINLEYNQNARNEGRFELFLENIETAIKTLSPIEIKNIEKSDKQLDTTGIIYISDAHYGRYCKMDGLFGEIISFYDVNEFKTRMWNLLSQLELDLKTVQISRLDIIDCGDNIEGILRSGDSLKNLQTGVIQSAIEYAEFMSAWVVECHNRLKVPVKYSLTGGNHDILRLLDSKPNFAEENIAKFIYKHIETRIEVSKLKAQLNNLEFDITLGKYNDVLYQNYYGTNILIYHGDTKNMKEDIEFFENYYQIGIDLLIGGHLHRNSSETIGIGYMGDREIIRLPSICGIDTYSKKIRKSSRAGAKFMTFSEQGKGWEKNYYLN